MPGKERNWALEKIRNLPKIIPLVNATKRKIQESASLCQNLLFPTNYNKGNIYGIEKRRKVNPGFNGDECFKNILLNVEAEMATES